MSLQPLTRVMIRRPNGKVETVTRHGTHDQHKMALLFQPHGAVVSVRHEHMPAGGGKTKPVAGKRTTLAIHEMKR